jgi:formylglycine-generating enzyme required for sulfatase activity
MRSLFTAGLFIVLAVFCMAQTPALHGPSGKKGPGPRLPVFDPPSYEPPPMVLIPEGEYAMGDHSGGGQDDEVPVHAVYIDAFYMDVFEVTNEEYCTYLNSAYSQGLIEVSNHVVYKTGVIEPYCNTYMFNSMSRIHWDGSVFTVTAGKEDHPMLEVSWYGAVAYANWRSAQTGLTPCYDLDTWECTFNAGGYRLPTEAEWEKAARGGEHSPYYDYPWGNVADGSKANYWQSGDPFEGTNPETTPVGYYDGNQIPAGVDMANGYGLYDMVGNVWEWCNDFYSFDYYQYCVDHGIYFNPTGPSSGYYHVFHSCPWNGPEYHLRTANRDYGNPRYRAHVIGFRLVK